MKDIHQLLDKYWKAETTLEEEQKIKAYLSENQLEENDDQLFFEALSSEKKVTSSLDEEGFLNLLEKETDQKKVFNLRPLLKYAAILMLPVAMVFSFKMLKMTDTSKSFAAIDQSEQRNIEDPEEAYRITMEALMFASNKLKKAETEVKSKLPLLNKTNILK